MSCRLHAPVMTFCEVLVEFALDATRLPEGQPPPGKCIPEPCHVFVSTLEPDAFIVKTYE